jgi:hypothetical protein
MWVVRGMHAGSVHWLHGQWRIAVEGIVVLDGRLVVLVLVGVVASTIVPCSSSVVIKMILVVVLLVVHLQLAHSLVGVVVVVVVDVVEQDGVAVYPCEDGV